jgi:hypothetical protein
MLGALLQKKCKSLKAGTFFLQQRFLQQRACGRARLWIKTAKRLYLVQPKRVFLTIEDPANGYDKTRPVASSDYWLFL